MQVGNKNTGRISRLKCNCNISETNLISLDAILTLLSKDRRVHMSTYNTIEKQPVIGKRFVMEEITREEKNGRLYAS